MIANAKRANASDEYVTVTSVAIADQITRELLPTIRRRQLVDDPFRRWVRSGQIETGMHRNVGLAVFAHCDVKVLGKVCAVG
jgi:hypothetical protein